MHRSPDRPTVTRYVCAKTIEGVIVFTPTHRIEDIDNVGLDTREYITRWVPSILSIMAHNTFEHNRCSERSLKSCMWQRYGGSTRSKYGDRVI